MKMFEYSIDHLLPANIDAEHSILGAILLDPKAYDEAVTLGLTAGDTSCDSQRRIYSAS